MNEDYTYYNTIYIAYAPADANITYTNPKHQSSKTSKRPPEIDLNE